MDGPWFFFKRESDRLSYDGRDDIPVHDGSAEFCNGCHHGNHIDELESALFRFFYGLLPGYDEQGHATKLCIGNRRDKVGGTRTQSGQTDSGCMGQSAISGRHETGGLFMPGQD